MRDVHKFQKLCSLCEENHYDIVALQETFWDKQFFEDHKYIWSGEVFASFSENNRQGVAFLVSGKFKNRVSEIFQSGGRFLHIQVSENDRTIDVVNVYFPNSVPERERFCENISCHIPKSDNLVFLGDFNTSLSPLDRSGKGKHVEDRACKALIFLLNKFNLYDVWRARNENARIFSWRRVVDNILLQSRIDFIFITKTISPCVKNIYYKHNAFSDHSFVVLNVDFSEVERGPGLWIFNNSLLNDENFVQKIDQLILKEKECPLFESEILVWIDNLKYKIKNLLKFMPKIKRKKNKQNILNFSVNLKKCQIVLQTINVLT